MESINKKIITITSIACIMTLLIGLFCFIFTNPNLHKKRENTISKLSDNWKYTTNLSDEPIFVQLPNKLPLTLGTNEITLTNYLPEKPIVGGVLRFKVLFQQADIYIDGRLRKSYGNSDINSFLYPYYNATHLIIVNLNPEDFGKELKIVLKSGNAFIYELSLIRIVEIGQHSDFILNSLVDMASNIFVIGLCMVIVLVLIIMSIIRYLKKQPISILVKLIVLTIGWVTFYSTDSLLLWEMFDYSPLYSAINELKFYVLDSFMTLTSFLILQDIFKFQLKEWKRKVLFLQCGLYIIGCMLHIMAVCSINYFRPILMVLAVINFLNVIREITPNLRKAELKHFGTGAIILLFGYFLDYLKYVLTLLPLSSEVLVFLQMKMPFMIFLGMAMVIYCGYVLYGIVMMFQNEQQRLQKKILIDELTGVYTRTALREEFDNMILDHKSDYYFAMIDIDNFKKVNDTYGHENGDNILKELGRILLKNHGNVKSFRFGGDEFCIIFKGKTLESSIEILKNIQKEFLYSTENISGNVAVTLSIGITKWISSQGVSTLVHKADTAMYKSKNSNKNCISIYEEEDLDIKLQNSFD